MTIMYKPISLVKALKVLFRAAFFLVIAVGGVAMLMDIFSTDGKIGNNGYFHPHHSEGYSMPVSIRVNFPDSIVSYNYQGGGRSLSFSKGWVVDGYKKELSDSLSKLPNVKKDVITNEVQFYPEEASDRGNLLLGRSDVVADGYVIFKPGNLFLSFLMILHTYLSLILFAACIFQLWKVFAALDRSFSFQPLIIKRLNWLGGLLVLGELVKVGIRMIFRSYCGLVSIVTLDNGRIAQGIDLSFIPILDVNWLLILLGLSVFVLSALLKIGQNLEEESQLTI